MNKSKTLLFALCDSEVQTDLMLRSLLAGYEGHRLTTATVHDESAALEVIPHLRPDTILLEVPASIGPARERLARFRKIDPTVPLVAWVDTLDPDLAGQLVDAGASDCLLSRTISPTLLVDALGLALADSLFGGRLRPDRYDPLTGLLSQGTLIEHVGRLLDRRRRQPSSSFAVLAVDVVNFYSFRDQFGHPMADELLVGLAARLLDSARPMDAVGRIPDAEFVLVLPEMALSADAWAVAWRLESGLTAPLSLRRHDDLQVYTRWGVTLANQTYDGPYDMLGAAVLESKTF